MKLQRAKKKALAVIRGDEEKQYNLLWDYAKEIRRSNRGSSVFLNLDANDLFQTMYFSLDACKRVFLEGCRPILFFDGCHLKTRHGGVMLTAIGIDPNDCVFLVAMAMVDGENKNSWKWFMNTLKRDLNIDNTAAYTIMSDKQKGLILAVEQEFPDCPHRFCVRHLYQNFNMIHKGEVLKDQLWACARSSNTAQLEINMDKLKLLSPEAHAWLDQHPPDQWCRAYYDCFCKSDTLMNNHCEVFNKYILNARELPILSMWEKIRLQLMHRMVEYARICENKWTGNICPKIMDKLQKNVKYANNCFPHKSGHGVYEVMSKSLSYEVNMLQNSCDCRRWQLTGIPCSHAAACMREERIKPETRIAACYTRDKYMKAYGHTIWPVRNKSFWEKTYGREVGAPMYKKKAGRKANKRREHPSEKEEGTRLSKHGVKMHCSHCRDPNHKRPSCPILHPEQKLQPRRRNNEEDIEDPSILEHIVPEEGIPELIPTQCSETLVDELLVEEITEMENFHSRRKGPLPSNAFVEEHINNIPAPRATTATRRGMTIARGRGKGRGRGRGRTNSSAASTSILDDVVLTTRGRAKVRGTRRRESTTRVTGSTSVVDDAIGPSGAPSNMPDDVPRENTRRPRSGARGDGAARERGRSIKHGRLYQLLFGSQ